MINRNEAFYQQVNQFVLACGSIHAPKEFAIGIVHKLKLFLPFDQARIYFINENGKMDDQHLVGVDKSTVMAYLEYYSQISDKYDIFKRVAAHAEADMYRPDHRLPIIIWAEQERDIFVSEYVSQIGLSQSTGFALYDISGAVRVLVMIDCISPTSLPEQGMELLAAALPHLNNLNKNFYNIQNEKTRIHGISWDTTTLTPREVEIATLLCRGMTPANISSKMNLSRATVYKHISHIYEKMHVSNRQEFMVRFWDESK